MQHLAPVAQRFVGGEHHRTPSAMPVVDDVEQQVGGVGAVREIADFIHDEDVGMRVRRERLREATRPEGDREIVDQFGGGDEARREAVLNGASTLRVSRALVISNRHSLSTRARTP